MKKQQDTEFATEIKKALRGKQVPVLVLDNRWHKLFPTGKKPADVEKLEKEVNRLLKRQGYLVNHIKDLKKSKRKLMDGIVAGMQGDTDFDDLKKDTQQRLMLEVNEQIDKESEELMQIPNEIKEANEALMMIGAAYCFERLKNGDEEVENLKQEIKEIKGILLNKTEEKEELEESLDNAYALMHGLLGHSIMNLYDKKHKTGRS